LQVFHAIKRMFHSVIILEDKVNAQRRIKEMEQKRNVLRRDLFESQDEIDRKKEDLIEEIEARLNQQITQKELFTIQWRLI